jgi:hypothetical protein
MLKSTYLQELKQDQSSCSVAECQIEAYGFALAKFQILNDSEWFDPFACHCISSGAGWGRCVRAEISRRE